MSKISKKMKNELFRIMAESYIDVMFTNSPKKCILRLAERIARDPAIGEENLKDIGMFLLTDKHYNQIFGRWFFEYTLKYFNMNLTLSEAKEILKSETFHFTNGWITPVKNRYETRKLLERVYVTENELMEHPDLIDYIAILSKRNPKLKKSKKTMLLFTMDGRNLVEEEIKLSPTSSRKSLKNIDSNTIIKCIDKFNWHDILVKKKFIPPEVLEDKRWINAFVMDFSYGLYYSRNYDYLSKYGYQLPFLTLKNLLSDEFVGSVGRDKMILLAMNQEMFFHALMEADLSLGNTFAERISVIEATFSKVMMNEPVEKSDYFSNVMADRYILAGVGKRVLAENTINRFEDALLCSNSTKNVFEISTWRVERSFTLATSVRDEILKRENERKYTFEKLHELKKEITDEQLIRFLRLDKLPDQYTPKYEIGFKERFGRDPIGPLTEEQNIEREKILGIYDRELQRSQSRGLIYNGNFPDLGTKSFNKVNVEDIKLLIEKGLIDPYVKARNLPTPYEILKLMEKYPDDIRAAGLIVDYKREDCVFLIDNINIPSGRADILNDLTKITPDYLITPEPTNALGEPTDKLNISLKY